MVDGLENIMKKEYLGRIIIIGRKDGKDVVVYAITGRSESSRARYIKEENGVIKTEPTDIKQLEKGNPRLLIYNCIKRYHDNIAVTNGAQTDLIYDTIKNLRSKGIHKDPIEVLVESFKEPYIIEGNTSGGLIDLTRYEPDEPNFTPRISGILTRNGAAMCISKWDDGKSVKHFFEVPLIDGEGKVIATYKGENVPKGHKIPSFEGEPLDITFYSQSVEDIARDVYEALGPKQGKDYISPGKDFRVGVAVLSFDRDSNRIESYIINRNK